MRKCSKNICFVLEGSGPGPELCGSQLQYREKEGSHVIRLPILNYNAGGPVSSRHYC